MMQKTTFRLGMVAAAMVLAMGSAQAASMRWAGANDILTIDPHAQNHQTTHAFLQQIYESLVRYDGKYQTEPALATKWTQISPTQVRFELRKASNSTTARRSRPTTWCSSAATGAVQHDVLGAERQGSEEGR